MILKIVLFSIALTVYSTICLAVIPSLSNQTTKKPLSSSITRDQFKWLIEQCIIRRNLLEFERLKAGVIRENYCIKIKLECIEEAIELISDTYLKGVRRSLKKNPKNLEKALTSVMDDVWKKLETH